MRRRLRRVALLALLAVTGAVVAAPAALAVGAGDPAPELAGIQAWINSPPRSLAALGGRVVLVNFWTFGCINCRHTLPHLKAWHERFADQGLVILGIHTPELPFERSSTAVDAAVKALGLPYPVAIDGHAMTWRAYGNRYWPAFYFVDKRGVVRHVRFGEGGYEESERWIEALLAE